MAKAQPAVTRPRIALLGGPDVHTRLALARWLTPRFDVVLIGSSEQSRAAAARAGVAYYGYPLTRRVHPRADFRSFSALVDICTSLRPDLVHTFDTKPNVYGRPAARRAGVPHVIGTVTGRGAAAGPGGTLLAAAEWPLLKLSHRLSDVIVFQTESDRRAHLRQRLLPTGRHVVIPGSGVDPDRFDPSTLKDARAMVRDELGVAPETTVVTMVSRVVREKGPLTFGAAAAHLVQSGTDIRFVLVGGTDDDAAGRLDDDELARLRDSVHWLGERHDVAAVLAASDIFALPTAYGEGVPRSMLEAAALELPLVTSGMPGCAEVVRHHDCGLVVDPCTSEALARAVYRLHRDPSLRRVQGRRGRAAVLGSFTEAEVFKRYQQLYESVLAGRSVSDA